MIQKVHLFLMMFTQCSPHTFQAWITEYKARRSHKKKFQDSNSINQCLASRTPRSKFNTTDSSNQVTRKFQIRVTPVNFSWGRPTVVWGWTDLGHQGSMSVFTRNKCYHNLDISRIIFPPLLWSQILTQPRFLGS